MAVSVVIPAINEADCIQRAVRTAWDAGAAEVIVVDGGSVDNTPRKARAVDAKVLNSRAGRAAQQNFGAMAATSEIVLFQHADCWLGPTSLEQIEAAFQHRPDRFVGAFRQSIEAIGFRYRLLEAGNLWRARVWGVPYGDQGIFFQRQFFVDAGQFPDVPIMEDLLLMLVIRQLHWPVILNGPLHVDARRWQCRGVVTQTFRNWSLVAARHLGVSPEVLARFYPRHDSDQRDGMCRAASSNVPIDEKPAGEPAQRRSGDDRVGSRTFVDSSNRHRPLNDRRESTGGDGFCGQVSTVQSPE